MAVNYYFSNFQNSSEQNLIEDLIIESIRIFGIDAWYINRAFGAKDELLNEDDLPIYDKAFMMEMYIKDVDGFGGDGDFLSKFGLEIRDQLTLTIAIRTFNKEVGGWTQDVRPQEGDLIYLPLNEKIFKIMHVEHEAIFYQMGQLQTYDLRCELFDFSGERFETGYDEIDTLLDGYNLTSNAAIANVESVDLFADNITIEAEADQILDFSEQNPFGEI